MEIKRDSNELVKNIQKAFDTSKEYSSNGFMVVNSILDLGKYYVVSMIPKTIPKGEGFNGGLFKLDKKLSKIEGFHPIMDNERYLKALQNPLYVKK